MNEKKIYYAGILILLPGVTAAILQYTGVLHLTKLLYPCLFRRLSGLYCPGCGGTRSVMALLRGDLLSCFLYHPFVFYCFALYAAFMISHTIAYTGRWIQKKKSPNQNFAVKGLSLHLNYLYIGIVVLLLQWMLKNLVVLITWLS